MSYASPDQKSAMEAIDKAISHIAALGECPKGHEIVNLLEKAKSETLWGDFPAKTEQQP